jgi:hypothetical protein
VSPEGASASRNAHTAESRPVLIWRCVFLAVETYVFSTIALLAIPDQFLRLDYISKSAFLGFSYSASFDLAWLFLLIASPFFLRSFRKIALAGWIMAFAALIIGLLKPCVI